MSADRAPRVTVHVPAYNYGRFLGDALDSLLGQTCTDWEAIVIDDASTDDTAAVVERYSDSRFHFVRHDANQGHIATYNEGLALARGDYFVILSADDRYRATFLTRTLACFDDHPDVHLVYTDTQEIDEHGRAQGRGGNPIDPDHDWVRDLSVTLMFGAYISGCAGIARTATLRACGGYEPTLPHTADLYLWRQLAFRGPVGHVTGRLLEHRDHTVAMHRETTWLDLMTTEEPAQMALLFDDPALPPAVAAQRHRVDAALAVAQARVAFRDRRYAAMTAALASAVRHDPNVVDAEHPLRTFARSYIDSHRGT